MSLNIDRIQKSVRKVGKFIRKNSKDPSPAAIHNVRTSTRSLESTFTALGLDSKRKVRRLLRGLRTVRKGAGKVRDMDVLTADTLSIEPDGEQECLVRLVEYLGAKRGKHATKLRFAVKKSRRQLRKDLKGSAKKLLKRAQNNGTVDSDPVPMTLAKAIKLSSDLNFPSSLNRKNLHPYRLKVKELRNILQLSKQTETQQFLKQLGDVKDVIGDWHDWEELVAIATQLLDHHTSCELMQQLKATTDSKYQRALFTTNRFRSHYLGSKGSKRGARRKQVSMISLPVLRATSMIAKR